MNYKFFSLIIITLSTYAFSNSSTILDALEIEEGFEISIFLDNIESPRQMTESDAGNIFVGSRTAGTITAIDTKNRKRVIASGLSNSTGVTYHDGDLYFSEVDKIWKIEDIDTKLKSKTKSNQFEKVLITNNLPSDTWHGWKWIDFGPDGALYISEGVPCNVCDEDDPRYGTILKLDNGKLTIYADGVRNSVGFDWHPETKEMYFTDNGRDWMGDDIPPCELNRVVNAGDHFGFPFVHGKDIPDTGYEAPKDFVFSNPVWEFQAHTAPLGIKFYDGESFPEYYKNGAFVAQHGSWNRSEKVGYRLLFMKMEEGDVVSADVFIDGWMSNETSWGRPVTPLILKDGSMLISDDQADSIIRVTYKG